MSKRLFPANASPLLENNWQMLQRNRRLFQNIWQMLRNICRLLRRNWQLLRKKRRLFRNNQRLLRNNCRLLQIKGSVTISKTLFFRNSSEAYCRATTCSGGLGRRQKSLTAQVGVKKTKWSRKFIRRRQWWRCPHSDASRFSER